MDDKEKVEAAIDAYVTELSADKEYVKRANMSLDEYRADQIKQLLEMTDSGGNKIEWTKDELNQALSDVKPPDKPELVGKKLHALADGNEAQIAKLIDARKAAIMHFEQKLIDEKDWQKKTPEQKQSFYEGIVKTFSSRREDTNMEQFYKDVIKHHDRVNALYTDPISLKKTASIVEGDEESVLSSRLNEVARDYGTIMARQELDGKQSKKEQKEDSKLEDKGDMLVALKNFHDSDYVPARPTADKVSPPTVGSVATSITTKTTQI